ncbi:hypothetical protein WN51_01593 [Melipona quadrifasciata]|uniref:Uncharacterized protein n=1 Tax=Melipona quadrifasciata TaxID=166423 RepID=A0A0M8ZUB7_9HYME|nr:hypothetical protein WN51_01593 [Melipona quadrifasciata]
MTAMLGLIDNNTLYSEISGRAMERVTRSPRNYGEQESREKEAALTHQPEEISNPRLLIFRQFFHLVSVPSCINLYSRGCN